MSKYKLEEVTYEVCRYRPSFKIIDNDKVIEDAERECGSISYLHDVSEEEAQLIVTAREKQVAKKPIAKHYEEEGEQPYIKYKCPSCENRYQIHPWGNKYCNNCGQKIDWD